MGEVFGTLLSRNAPRRWQKLHRSKASLDGQRSKTSASDREKRSVWLRPTLFFIPVVPRIGGVAHPLRELHLNAPNLLLIVRLDIPAAQL
jgi:hypothetical protein